MIGDIPSNGSVLRSLGGRKLLFSETDQAVYELDELTAFVLQSLQTGTGAEAIVTELVAAGIAAEAAARAVEAAIAQLKVVRKPRPAPKPAVTRNSYDRLVRFSVEIPGASVVELYLSEDLLPDVMTTVGYLQAVGSQSDCEIVARAVGGNVEFLSPGAPMWQCDRSEFVAALKAELLEQVLRFATYEVALHTAALVRNCKALLLAGCPGAGKSTLALALTRAGWELAADDVALLDERGRITGLPFPLTAKAASWPLIDEHWPELATHQIYRRPDGFDVRYIMPEPVSGPGPWEIGSCILLDRRAGASARLEDVEPTSMLATLLAEATSHDQQLTEAGFSALVSALGNARCARLTYGDLLEGAGVVSNLHS